jgi:hypothetical protein
LVLALYLTKYGASASEAASAQGLRCVVAKVTEASKRDNRKPSSSNRRPIDRRGMSLSEKDWGSTTSPRTF